MSKPPEIIGSYKILSVLGQGGMGVVYCAQAMGNGRCVALKTVRVTSEAMIQSIRREIRALARIKHPGIVKILDQGVDKGLPWYAMELLPGCTLRQYLHLGVENFDDVGLSSVQAGALELETAAFTPVEQQNWWTMSLTNLQVPEETSDYGGRKPTLKSGEQPASAVAPNHQPRSKDSYISRILTIMRRLCASLAFLHGEGMVHRDLKPDNIFIKPDGKPVLVDFGLMAHFSRSISREMLYIERGGLGTLKYIAPEQITGGVVDARADFYSFGCILYELLTSQPPFSGHNTTAIIQSHLYDAPDPPSLISSYVDPKLDNLVLRLLAKDPRDRPGHADSIAAVLAELGAENGGEEPGPAARTYLYRSSFSGRESQLSALRKSLDRLRKNQGGLVLISGESGVGKTRLVIEIGKEAAANDIDVLTGECLEHSTLPLEALRKPLQSVVDRCFMSSSETDSLLGKRGKVLAQYVPALNDLPGLIDYPPPAELPAREARLRLFLYLSELFENMAENKPLLLILDDLHWADDLILDFLLFILRGELIQKSALLILGTFRKEELTLHLQKLIDHNQSINFDLDRLGEEAVKIMVSDMLALSAPPAEFSGHLFHLSEGNPFFVAEYLRAAIDKEVLRRDESGNWQVVVAAGKYQSLLAHSALSLPKSIQELINHRLHGLPASTWTVVKTAAIMKREFTFALLQEMSPLSETDFFDATEELIRRHVLEKLDLVTLRFAHNTIRESAYAHIDQAERCQLHQTAAQILEQMFQDKLDEFLAELGHHWEQAGDLNKARDYYYAAAHQALHKNALKDAEILFRHCIRLYPPGAKELIQARYELAHDVLHLQGRNKEAINQLEVAIAEARATGNHDGLAQSQRLLGLVYKRSGQISRARQLYEQALNHAHEVSDPCFKGLTLGNLAAIHHDQGHLTAARELFEQALIIARQTNNRFFEGQTVVNLAIIHYSLGHMDQALALYEDALKIVRENGDRRFEGWTLGNLAILHKTQGRMDEARKLYETALDIIRDIGDRTFEGRIMGNLAILHKNQGRVELALQLYHEALSIVREIGDRRFEGQTMVNMASLYYSQKQSEEALTLYEQALLIVREIGDRRVESLTLVNLANVYYDQGQISEAQIHYDQAHILAEKIGDKQLQGQVLCNLASFTRRTTGNVARAQKLITTAHHMLSSINDLMTLTTVLTEQTYCTLAQNRSAQDLINTIKEMGQELNINPDARLYRDLDTLIATQKAWENQQQSLLFRGELLTDFSAELRQWLKQTGQLPGKVETQ
ncbi:tetratricopeptide repeat protein [candidate division CSSED10-310 bacterium]|uniref:Tetratricopeptide repeat protein n=1 Tax=candidate division CSSED10-310 bacterium TaxID=2855610 RepID=A0ABV6Z3G6_UNCC1